MPKPQKQKTKRVSKEIIRQKFNNGPLPELIKRGTLRETLISNHHIRHPKPFQGPYCTHSQVNRYVNSSGKIVAELHRYLRPDGSFGASGRWDPKRIREGETLLYVID